MCGDACARLFSADPLFSSCTRAYACACRAQTQAFVDGLFDMTRDLKSYKAHLRDFLIAVLEFKVEDAELFGEEKADAAATAAAAERDRRRAVPGLLNPYEAEGMEDL